MTMRERLIELLNDWGNKENDGVRAESMADYLLANGIIVPPCKVGDTVYCIVEGFDVVMEGHIRQLIVAEGIFIDCVIRGYFNQVFHSSKIGKTVFLTREEAEQALRKEDEGK